MKHLSEKEKEILAEIDSGIFHGISTKENIRELLAMLNSLREEYESLVKTHDDNITICKALQDVCKQVEPEMTKLMLERDLLLMECDALRNALCIAWNAFEDPGGYWNDEDAQEDLKNNNNQADAIKVQRENLK